METDTRKYNQQRRDYFAGQTKKYQSQLRLLSYLRLVLFVFFAWFLVMAIRNRFQDSGIWVSLSMLVGFLVAVLLADRLKKKISLWQQLLFINENELLIEKGGTSQLDNGARFSGKQGFTTDLSVFGNHSLFHLLNRTGSQSGKNSLRALLMHPLLQPSEIIARQAAVQELSTKTDFGQQLLAHTLLLKEGDSLQQLQTGIDEGAELLNSRFWSLMAQVWPVMGAVMVGQAIVSADYRFLLIFGMLGFLILTLINKKQNPIYQHISKRSYLFGQYAACFQLIADQAFEDPYLLKQKEQVVAASSAFRKLARLVDWYDLRLNMLSFFLNPLFLTDLLCARAYLKWQHTYQTRIGQWFASLGEMESLFSLAVFHNNHPDYVFPRFSNTDLKIQARGMGHPLMKSGTAVLNDIFLGDPEQLYLITGSNMSGKSTYLRTLGLNMILAQTGAPVYAKEFICRPMNLLTSFHHIDSLEDSTSYFYAELTCLKNIMDALSGEAPALVLLDEVMRGTNSRDKHDGTALLIRKLLEKECLVCIATHDTELGILADSYPGAIANFCFESELTDSGLHFDFTKRAGVAQTRNATYLMQQMGII
ncbi:MAG: hypothetical protein KGO92_02730 [Bacteroidota bacterium]|nr:hypothetical protein [Bacteroidota bacterium]